MSAINQYLSFRIGREEYGIDILKVQEIRGYEPATRMVNAPSHVLGVLNLRGTIIPVIDQRLRFGLSEPIYDAQTVTIVLGLSDKAVGMVVDSVTDVVNLPEQDIKPAPEFSGSIGQQDVIGLGTVEQGGTQRMLILLDIERVMGGANHADAEATLAA
jgi:purine-binding chemotaxis protein CheW